MRWVIFGLCALSVVALSVAPSAAEAQQLAPDMVSGMVVEMMLEGALMDVDYVLEVPDVQLALAAVTRRKTSLAVPSAVHFFGRGIDISAELTGDARDGSVMLALKPNFGKQGGVLRCTFRF